LTDSYQYFGTAKYDSAMDVELEEMIKKMILSKSSYSPALKQIPSIYFTTYSPRARDFIYSFFTYLNEKIYDNPGFFYTIFQRQEGPQKLSTLGWFSETPLIAIEFIPTPQFNWRLEIIGKEIINWNFLSSNHYFSFYEKFSKLFVNIFSYGISNYYPFLLELHSGKLYIKQPPIYSTIFLQIDFSMFLVNLNNQFPENYIYNFLQIISNYINLMLNMLNFDPLNSFAILIQKNLTFFFINNSPVISYIGFFDNIFV